VYKRQPEDSISQWLKLVSSPVFSLLEQTINSFEYQIECLSADPFDDELLANFSDYIDQCRQAHQQAQHHLRQRRPPTAVGTVASHLFHALNALGDGIEELHYFTLNFDDRHLHTAQELWHRAEEMRAYAQYAVTNLTGIGAKH
jgi:molecular chaperone DnaJ